MLEEQQARWDTVAGFRLCRGFRLALVTKFCRLSRTSEAAFKHQMQHTRHSTGSNMTGWFWGFNVGNYPSTIAIEHIRHVLKELMSFFKQKMAQESLREEVLNDEENGTRCHRPIIVDLGIVGKKIKGKQVWSDPPVHFRLAQTSLHCECCANDLSISFWLTSEHGLKRERERYIIYIYII